MNFHVCPTMGTLALLPLGGQVQSWLPSWATARFSYSAVHTVRTLEEHGNLSVTGQVVLLIFRSVSQHWPSLSRRDQTSVWLLWTRLAARRLNSSQGLSVREANTLTPCSSAQPVAKSSTHTHRLDTLSCGAKTRERWKDLRSMSEFLKPLEGGASPKALRRISRRMF